MLIENEQKLIKNYLSLSEKAESRKNYEDTF